MARASVQTGGKLPAYGAALPVCAPPTRTAPHKVGTRRARLRREDMMAGGRTGAFWALFSHSTHNPEDRFPQLGLIWQGVPVSSRILFDRRAFTIGEAGDVDLQEPPPPEPIKGPDSTEHVARRAPGPEGKTGDPDESPQRKTKTAMKEHLSRGRAGPGGARRGDGPRSRPRSRCPPNCARKLLKLRRIIPRPYGTVRSTGILSSVGPHPSGAWPRRGAAMAP